MGGRDKKGGRTASTLGRAGAKARGPAGGDGERASGLASPPSPVLNGCWWSAVGSPGAAAHWREGAGRGGGEGLAPRKKGTGDWRTGVALLRAPRVTRMSKDTNSPSTTSTEGTSTTSRSMYSPRCSLPTRQSDPTVVEKVVNLLLDSVGVKRQRGRQASSSRSSRLTPFSPPCHEHVSIKLFCARCGPGLHTTTSKCK
jgi:hypothetical protein